MLHLFPLHPSPMPRAFFLSVALPIYRSWHRREQLAAHGAWRAVRVENMSRAQNMKIQEAFGEATNTGKLDNMVNLVAKDCIDHDPAPGQVPGPQGYIAFFTEFRAAFPDLAVAVEHMTADDESVAMAYTVTGTQLGAFLGVAPTGKKISARGVQIAKFNNGKMVERWGSSDQLEILGQIGVSPIGK